MPEDLRYDVPNIYIDVPFHDDEANLPKHGRFYTWDILMQGENSSASNPSGVQGICPNGWHLPSKEEWNQLLQDVFGNNNQEAYAQLIPTGDTGMNIGLDGYKYGNWWSPVGNGYYWTTTAYDSNEAWVAGFGITLIPTMQFEHNTFTDKLLVGV